MVQLGILGSGQLALMLAEAAKRLGASVICWADQPGSPAERAGFPCLPLERVLEGSEKVIFENEFVDCGRLRAIAAGESDRFLPRLEVIELFQDKANQKRLLRKIGAPTAPFEVLPNDFD